MLARRSLDALTWLVFGAVVGHFLAPLTLLRHLHAADQTVQVAALVVLAALMTGGAGQHGGRPDHFGPAVRPLTFRDTIDIHLGTWLRLLLLVGVLELAQFLTQDRTPRVSDFLANASTISVVPMLMLGTLLGARLLRRRSVAS